MNSIDQQFVEFIVKSLVGKPDAVQVERRIDEKGVLLELTVDPEDLGRVIGKRGATAQSLRTLLRALGTKNDARYNLKIVDNGEGGPYEDAAGSAAEGATAAGIAGVSAGAGVLGAAGAMSDTNGDGIANGGAHAISGAADDEDNRDSESRVSKTRQELADLDDLDV